MVEAPVCWLTVATKQQSHLCFVPVQVRLMEKLASVWLYSHLRFTVSPPPMNQPPPARVCRGQGLESCLSVLRADEQTQLRRRVSSEGESCWPDNRHEMKLVFVLQLFTPTHQFTGPSDKNTANSANFILVIYGGVLLIRVHTHTHTSITVLL